MQRKIKTCVSLDSPKKLSKDCLKKLHVLELAQEYCSARSVLIPEEHCDFRSINQSVYMIESLWRQYS